ncbi:hypothetical protein CDL12_01363 [Handroanthus impetiginosus]|uniref:Growth-regulating factor n=1 Tax=Handroanthus impetiginosus TaxID=429701 RepID=A0A2G9I809_9LAMI|nr:hypothetical protein CDL12_01363 [Handroanthus impetiginosus]
MNSNGRSCKFPFTASQWQELEHQALVFKYMISGLPVPPDLLFTIRRGLDSSSLSSKFLIHQAQNIGWKSFHMGFGGKIDPEPGRCRRTDGKKWRCSKDAYPDSKYCERHMHRGRNRSRKPVEILSQNAIPINVNKSSSITNKNTTNPSNSYLASPSEPRFLYSHFSSPRPPGLALSSQENTTNFNFLEPNAHSHKDFRHGSYYGEGAKGETEEANSISDSSWKLTMGSSLSQIKPNAYSSDLQSRQWNESLNGHYYPSDMPSNIERDIDQPKKVTHHFLDEWEPKDKDSWPSSENKLSSNRTQLSISIPNSLHDFFMTQK